MNANISTKTVTNLRKMAKNRGLTGYSKLKKANLVNLITKKKPKTPSPNRPSSISKKTVANLRKMAKNRGLTGYSKLKKANLVNMITKGAKSPTMYNLFGTPLSSPSLSPVPTPEGSPSPQSPPKNCITRSKIPLHDYQKRVIQALRHHRGICAVHSVGSGKTLTAVAASQCFLDANPMSHVYVCTPVSLMGNFRKEMVKYGISADDPRYTILSHDTMWRSVKEKKVDPRTFRNDMIIIDEVHNFRSLPLIAKVKGKTEKRRAFYMREAVCEFKKVLALTATPIMNSEKDLVNIVSFLTGEKYADRIADAPEHGQYYSQNDLIPHILNKAHDIFSFYQRPKDDGRFPSYDITNVNITMPETYFRQYVEIETHTIQQELSYRTDIESFYTHIRNAVNKIDNTLDSPKVLWTLKKTRQIVGKGGRLIIYSAFLNSGIHMIGENLRKLKIPYNYISGEISASQRTAIVEDYNSGKVPVLLITRAGGEGLDLKGTTAAIMMEPTWNPSAEAQVFGRAVRSGSHTDMSPSKRKVECYLLFLVKPRPSFGKYADLSADQVIYNFVTKKRTMIRQMTDVLSRTGVERIPIEYWSPERKSKNVMFKRTPH